MRLYSMMKIFLEKEDYCSLEVLVQKLGVSKRTVQNDLSYLMQVSPRKGFRLHMRRGKGYLLEITNEELFNDFLKSLNEGLTFQTKERSANILSFLAIQDDYISMDTIANTMLVSKTLIKKDMKEVEQLALSYHLLVERKSHYGVKLIANDKCLKLYLVDAYLNQNVFVQTAINDVVKDFKEVEDYFIRQLELDGLNINYNELLNITEYLKVMVYVSFKQKEKEDHYLFDKQQPIEHIVLLIINLLKNLYHVEFSNESIDELITIFKKNIKRMIGNSLYLDHLESDIEIFLEKTDEIYQTKFQEDDDFKKMFLKHVILLVDRLHNKISYRNALANELSITNPTIFNVAIQFCDMLRDKYGVTATFDEVGFIAMHFAGHMEKEKQWKLQSYNRIGVICSSGGGSAYMIKLQIESLFPQAIVQTFSFLQQEELTSFQPDLIFTVMPLSGDFQVPIIYIKELLDDRDLYRIKQILQCEDYDPYVLVNENPLYYSFFSKEFFKIIEAKNYEQIICEMAKELEEKEYGKEGYAQLVLERESFVSTVYMNGVCIPHPLETDAKRNMISVSILKQPFLWHDKWVKIIFMICLRKEEIELYKVVTKKLYRLMQETEYLNRILKAKSFEEMMVVMKEMGGIDHD